MLVERFAALAGDPKENPGHHEDKSKSRGRGDKVEGQPWAMRLSLLL
jgi:hypothetical protein